MGRERSTKEIEIASFLYNTIEIVPLQMIFSYQMVFPSFFVFVFPLFLHCFSFLPSFPPPLYLLCFFCFAERGEQEKKHTPSLSLPPPPPPQKNNNSKKRRKKKWSRLVEQRIIMRRRG